MARPQSSPPDLEARIADTREVFQPFYAEPLSDDDCREIIMNVSALFEMLYGKGRGEADLQASASAKK